MKIDLIAGARPNFVKIAPIVHAIIRFKELGKCIDYRLVHTGQHYDSNMSGSFFRDLDISEPDVNLVTGGGTQAEQTAKIMIGYEKLLNESPTDLCLVVGDVNSTMACSVTAKKMNVPLAHVEAGIRSGDRSMPEEINRLITDSITDYFFTTTKGADENLLSNGVNKNSIFRVGNTMIDTLLMKRSSFRKPIFWDKYNLKKNKFIIVTLHRPANVDEELNLKVLIETIVESAGDIPIVFPVHPRTRSVLDKLGIHYDQLIQVEALPYLEFNFLVERAKAVITDSGGITEETTVMGVPCMTLRDSTERPETINQGTNELLGVDPKAIAPAMAKLYRGEWKRGAIPELWDGKTANRIVEKLLFLKKEGLIG